jgi:serine/threonine protein kinase
MSESSAASFEVECNAAQLGLSHPNILRMLGAGRSNMAKGGKKGTQECFYLVSSICRNGDSFDYVAAAGGLAEPYARQFYTQFVSAVDYVHSKGIAHRDLKLENVLLDEDCAVKLMDFGMYKLFTHEALKTFIGTPNYMAPEMNKDNTTPYEGPPIDIFAMGHMLYIVLTGMFLFNHSHDKNYSRF